MIYCIRILLIIPLLFTFVVVRSQRIVAVTPVHFQNPLLSNDLAMQDSSSQHTWSVTTFGRIFTGVTFLRGGSAGIFATPMFLQLNRRLNNNFYAFANVSVTPAVLSIHPTLISSLNNSFKYTSPGINSFSVNPSASIGVMYVNDAKTFSISGSFSAERNSYLVPPYYTGNASNKNISARPAAR